MSSCSWFWINNHLESIYLQNALFINVAEYVSEFGPLGEVCVQTHH